MSWVDVFLTISSHSHVKTQWCWTRLWHMVRGVDFLQNLVQSTPILLPFLPFPLHLPLLSPSPIVPLPFPSSLTFRQIHLMGLRSIVSSPAGSGAEPRLPTHLRVFRLGNHDGGDNFPLWWSEINVYSFKHYARVSIAICGRLQHLSKTWLGPLMGWTL